MKKKTEKQMTESELDKILEEIINYLIGKNLDIIEYEKKQEYKNCSLLKESIMVYINDMSRILNEGTSTKKNEIYQNLHQQNDLIRDKLFKNK